MDSVLQAVADEVALASDRSIRAYLHFHLQHYVENDPTAIVVDELQVSSGLGRVDVALLNNSFHGFEIKSERDTLSRLESQVLYYSEVIDFMTLVVVEKFVEKALVRAPSWWGITVVRCDRNGVHFESLREAKQNPSIDVNAFLEFLLRDEMFDILEERGISKGFRSANKVRLMAKIASTIPWDDLHSAVLNRVKARRLSKRSFGDVDQPVVIL